MSRMHLLNSGRPSIAAANLALWGSMAAGMLSRDTERGQRSMRQIRQAHHGRVPKLLAMEMRNGAQAVTATEGLRCKQESAGEAHL